MANAAMDQVAKACTFFTYVNYPGESPVSGRDVEVRMVTGNDDQGLWLAP